MRDALLLMTIGMCAYLALMRLWFGRSATGPGRWAGVWATGAALFAASRLVGLDDRGADLALACARFGSAASLVVMWSVAAFVESLCFPRRQLSRLAPVIFAIGALFWLTPLGIAELEPTSGAADGEPFRVMGGPLLPVLGLAMLATLAGSAWMLSKSADLPRVDRAIVCGLLVAYAAVALASFLNSVGLVEGQGLVEFAPLVAALGIGHLVQRHQFRLETKLVSQVAQRSRELAESEARYRDVVENMPIGLLSVDARGQLEHANAKLLSMLGSTFSEFAGAFDLLSEENARSSGFSPMLARALASGEAFSSEFEFDSWWGRKLVTRTSVAPRRDEKGAITGALAIVEDITEQRSIERRVREAQRVEAVGQLAAGIAHEINNPLAYVRANLSMLSEEVDGLAKSIAANAADSAALATLAALRLLLEDSLASVARTVSVVRDLREFSHANSARREATDVNALLENAARLAATRSQSAHEVRLDLGSVPAVSAAPGQLAQVMLTLLIQARHAAGTAGTVSASTTSGGDDVIVLVHDDGAPIPAGERARVFEPFAKVRSGEPSLALYVARQIVQDHGGRIEVRSSAEQGTTFCVHLPACKDREE
jgi:PAS domain S-box-containing protein